MICPKCGTDNPEGSRFCSNCGSQIPSILFKNEANANNDQSLNNNDSNNQGFNNQGFNNQGFNNQGFNNQGFNNQGFNNQGFDNQNQGFNNQGFNNQNPAPAFAKPPINKAKLFKIIGISAGAVIAIVVTILLIVNRKTKIDLNDYIKVNYTGYNGYGNTEVDFDYDKLYTDVCKAAGFSKKELEDIELTDLILDTKATTKKAKKIYNIYKACDKLDYKLSKESKLSNGDKIKLTFKFDNDLAKKIKVKFVGKEKELEVKGLKKIEEYNPFDHITVTFEGMAPNANVNIEYDEDDDYISLFNFDYDYDKDYHYDLGDEVTITLSSYSGEDSDEDLEDYYASQGIKVTETEKTYTVENVDAYASEPEDLDTSIMSNMKSGARDAIISYFASNKSYIRRGSLKYEGYFFLNNKDSDTWDYHNIIYVIYSTKVTSKKKEFKPTTVYLPVKFYNAIKYADGTVSIDDLDADSYDICGDDGPEYGWWDNVKGYKRIGVMKNELLTSNKSNYITYNEME
ncbi:MAG: zinc ribbon domain-containing protein [Lachnospiraceae bacterium]|nr:zinc ribbon domain-containing protein [Lachnospiraceae bacterium]